MACLGGLAERMGLWRRFKMNIFCEELYAKYCAALDDIRYLQGRIVELEEILKEIQED